MKRNRSRRLASGVLVTAAALLAALGLSGFGEGKTPVAPAPFYSQTCASATLQKAGDQVQLTMRKVSRATLFFGRPASGVATALDTRAFVSDWTATFGGVQPSATLTSVTSVVGGGGLQLGAITRAQYRNGDVIYLVKPVTPTESGRLPVWSPFPSLPATLGPSVLVIDPAGGTDPEPPSPGTPSPGTPSPGTPSPGTPSPGTPASPSSGAMYGMACGYWQKPVNDYQDISKVPHYFDDYFKAVAQSAQWITDYGLSFPADLAFVRAAKAAGLKVCVCADPTWDAGGPASTNQAQIDNAVALVREGTADKVVIGNEVLNKFDKAYGYVAWKTDMIRYIDQVKAAKGPGGRSVPVGTSYAMSVCDDAGKAQEKAVNQECDFIQVTIHPANVARDQLPWGPGGKAITTPDDGIWFLDKTYRASRAQLDAWGLQGTPLEVRETGWPSQSHFGNTTDACFTVANAQDYYGKVLQWAATGNVNVYWFEGVDEPQKDSHHPGIGQAYDLLDFEANWGLWHWTPVDPKNLSRGGKFSRKY